MLTKLLIALLLISFPLGQLVRWEFLGSQVVLRPNDLITYVLGFHGLCLGSDPVIREFVRKRSVTGSDPVIKALFLWYLAMILSLAVNSFNYTPTQLLISASYIVRFILYSGLYFVFKDLKLSKNYLVYICLVIALFGFTQYFIMPDMSYLQAFDWDPHYYRLISTFLDPGFTGMILLLGLVLTKNKIFIILIYSAMALTYSRTTFLAFLAVYAVISWYQKSPKLFFKAFILIIFTIIVLPRTFGDGTKLSRETSTWARLENWKQSFVVFSKSPIFGVGYNTYRYNTNASLSSHAGAGADSSLFLVLATTGIFGFLAYLNLLRVIYITNKSYVFKASFIGVIIASFFNNTLFYPYVMEWLWILPALL